MADILIIDDDAGIRYMLSRIVEEEGHTPHTVETLSAGRGMAEKKEFDVVFLDVHMPDGNGLRELPFYSALKSEPEILVITGKGEAEDAVEAVRKGALDYIDKVGSIAQITQTMQRALKHRKKKLEAKKRPFARESIIGNSQVMKTLLEQAASAAASDVSVLLTGETGTGKEIFAKAVHINSRRKNAEFVIVDCAALPKNLVESVLFGHVRGAFTGADSAKEGLCKLADGGTLFLDEVGELSLDVQKAFLRVLQERKFRPVGSQAEVKSDFRLIAATNRDLNVMAENGSFRPDLLFRLKSFVVDIPPLRRRREDIEDISRHHIKRICSRYGIEEKHPSPEFLTALASYDWPGNVRELVQTLESAVALSNNESHIYPEHLPTEIRAAVMRKSFAKGPSPRVQNPGATAETQIHDDSAPVPLFKEFRKVAVDKAEKSYLELLMRRSKGSIKKALDMSGLSRTRLYMLMKKHGISRKQEQEKPAGDTDGLAKMTY